MKAVNLGSCRWVERGMRAQFASSSRAFGVLDAEGRALSIDGVRPSVWTTKRIAVEVAQSATADAYHWVAVELPARPASAR